VTNIPKGEQSDAFRGFLSRFSLVLATFPLGGIYTLFSSFTIAFVIFLTLDLP
jgi:hypothetical protein